MQGLANAPLPPEVTSFPGVPTPPLVVDGALLRSFPGAAALLSNGRFIGGNENGARIAAALRDPLPAASAQCRVVLANQQYDLTLLPAGDGDILMLARDSSLDKSLIDALTRSRQMFRDIVLCSSDFAWEATADGRFGFVTPRGALGYAASELAGKATRELAADAIGAWPFDDGAAHDETEVRLRSHHGEARTFVV
jgi:PAS domain-containing protein